MKIRFIKSSLISVLVLSIATIGCLKDKAFENGSIQSGSGGSGQDTKVISLGLTVSSNSYDTESGGTVDGVQFLQQSYPLTPNDTTVDLVPVELGGLSAATQDIHITLTENDALVEAYNDSTGSDFVNPGAYVTIVNNVVTIPKGSRIGYLQVKFNPNDLLNGNLAYGFTITAIAESGYVISGNLKDGIVGIGPKNQYDGVYKSAGHFFHPAYGDLLWDYSKGITQNLVTTGLNSLSMYPTNTSIGGFGAELDITVNPDNTLIEVFNGVTTPTPNSDHYDPTTRTFYVSGAYMGASGPRTYNATLMYKGSR